MTLRTGFIGLGKQGKPIPAHLAPAGSATPVYDVVQAPADESVAGGAQAAGGPSTRSAKGEKDLAWALQLRHDPALALPFGGRASQPRARLYRVRVAGRR